MATVKHHANLYIGPELYQDLKVSLTTRQTGTVHPRMYWGKTLAESLRKRFCRIGLVPSPGQSFYI
ncbi:hypothetical protein SBF1_3930005 [Candidatus Desulfosporosinus infrequens]|uniref:Uncharacterized protein n=1 Tax=Candidatus Desulfosporosinus infrequens TaxID=2043169 RepID=A0A2U3L6S2_9FIRM|nr:hypothetical protein SBF1_3930005 [Candidatus Desulfosporosinus infrequens]